MREFLAALAYTARYYEKITEAIKGDNKELRDAALGSLANDPGLHQLVPYFCQFIADEVTKNIKKTRLLYSLMQMIKALLDSPHIRISIPRLLTPPFEKQILA